MEQLTKEYFDRLWHDSIPQDGMKHNKETWNKLAEKWKNDTEDSIRQKDKTAEALMSFLEGRGALKKDFSAIDVGCGSGTYAIPLARHVKNVLATDLSSVMLETCRERAEKEGLKNIEYLEADFAAMDVQKQGWENKFDLVFTSLTPAMSGLDSINKLNTISHSWGFNNSFLTRSNSILNDVLVNVFDKAPLNTWGNSSPFCLFNILWLNGNQPEMTYFDEDYVFMSNADLETAEELTVTAVKNRTPKDEDIQKTLKYLESIADENGQIKTTVKSVFAWTLWRI